MTIFARDEGRDTTRVCESTTSDAICRTRDTYAERSRERAGERTRLEASRTSALAFSFRCLVIPREESYVDDARRRSRNVKTARAFPREQNRFKIKSPLQGAFSYAVFSSDCAIGCAHHIHGRGRSALGGVGVRGGRVVDDGEDDAAARTLSARTRRSASRRDREGKKRPARVDEGKQPDARSASPASSATRGSRIRLRVEYLRVSRSAL